MVIIVHGETLFLNIGMWFLCFYVFLLYTMSSKWLSNPLDGRYWHLGPGRMLPNGWWLRYWICLWRSPWNILSQYVLWNENNKHVFDWYSLMFERFCWWCFCWYERSALAMMLHVCPWVNLWLGGSGWFVHLNVHVFTTANPEILFCQITTWIWMRQCHASG